MIGIRYTDSSGEFISRERSPTNMQLAFLFIFACFVCSTLVVFVKEPFILIVTLILIMLVAGWYVIFQIQRNRDLLLSTEFQNALFTSALGSNNKFCLIVQNNYDITYMDRAFYNLFSGFIKTPYRNLESLFRYGEVAEEERNKIYAAIEHNVKESVVFTIKASDDKPHRIFLSVEPIARPSGYTLLRARDYIEKRAAVTAKDTGPAAKFPLFSTPLISGLLEKDAVVYLADKSGALVYVSTELESQLGYGEHEILSRSMNMQDIIYVGNSKPTEITLEDYEGEIILQKKDGSLSKFSINQKLAKDRLGNTVGCSAFLNSPEQASTKKKIW
jgi:PAS domain-containing protein